MMPTAQVFGDAVTEPLQAETEKVNTSDVAARISGMRAEYESVVANAKALGMETPQILGSEALGTDATSLQRPEDVANLVSQLDGLSQGIKGEQGKQLQATAGQIIEGGMAAILPGSIMAAVGDIGATMTRLGVVPEKNDLTSPADLCGPEMTKDLANVPDVAPEDDSPSMLGGLFN